MDNPHQPYMDPNDPAIIDTVESLAQNTGVQTDTLEGRQITDMLQTVLKLIPDGRHAGELKLLNASLKELRYAYRIFADYQNIQKIAIFGSARTPEDHPDYLRAVEFASLMANDSWMVITGAGDGIMKAGHEGPGRDASFGVAIRLPFETSANAIIAGDEKLINFRYFFTRKLIFVSQSNAVALFPGGFGTQDEFFESLTLIQTGKSQLVPIVMLSGDENGAQTEGGYWHHWDEYIQKQLLTRGWISEPDLNLYYLAKNPQDATDHIRTFYYRYHSARYVRDQYAIRLKKPLTPDQLNEINERYPDLLASGKYTQSGPLNGEKEYLGLQRLVFHHTRRDWGRMRTLIDTLNTFE